MGTNMDATTTKTYLSYCLKPLSALKRIHELEIQAGQFREVFMDQQYYWLWSRIMPHTTLFDIGTQFGDTASYFATNPNVDKVITYEIDPKVKAYAQNLLAHSPLLPKIEFRGEANVSVLAADLVGLKNIAIKCDIEGAERDLFSHANLSKVYAIQLEYHDCLKEVGRVLRHHGFKVRSKEKRLSFAEQGYLYAEK